jgi:diphosphomevalonate decarboxylase
VYFTLDAGPNIHLLYPQSIKNEVENWIDSELKQFCENGLYIKDDVGDGPKKIG